ncbi:MAG TPA: hypothetical protein VNU93_07345, partial [Verrucomicrobiae bacterium]|nr:hypothetical protein [Verrucomicrobiae bacterium]
EVINRAKNILSALEAQQPAAKSEVSVAKEVEQLSFVMVQESEGDKLLEQLRTLDLNGLTPLDALNLLAQWQTDLKR